MSEDEKAACEERLFILASASGVGYQVIANLRCESRLDEIAFRDIVQGLIEAAAEQKELEKVYIEKCRQHILEGDAIPKPWPLYFGRAVTCERFCKIALQFSDVEETELQLLFDDLISKPFDAVKRRFQEVLKSMGDKALGHYVIWATFNPEDLEGKPFDRMPADADGIRARLGLDPNEKGKDLICFVYVLPPDVEPLFPTIADAQWYSLFRPAPPGAKWGLTMPWPQIAQEKPRPEVVHKEITGSTVEKIEIARART